jgi:DNA polymerase-3 subunit alpha
MIFIFDTETTGLPIDKNAPISDLNNWPRMVQFSGQLHELDGNLVTHFDCLIIPEGYNIPFNAEKIHGISTMKATEKGIPLEEALEKINNLLAKATIIAGHNLEFDIKIIAAEFFRKQIENQIFQKKILDTQLSSVQFCALPGGKGGSFKYPKLEELHQKLFNKGFDEAHNAIADVEATARCFFELVKHKIITDAEINLIPNISDYLLSIRAEILAKVESRATDKSAINKKQKTDLGEINVDDISFSHLHVHSQYSVLKATPDVGEIIAKAVEYNMPAVALVDHQYMYGAFHFLNKLKDYNKEIIEENKKRKKENPDAKLLPLKIKGIVGCEFNVCKNRIDKENKNNGFQIPLIAKNKKGYHNLAKMSSIANAEGFYYVPRIDKSIVEKYKEDVIAFTGSKNGEIPWLILNVGEKQAEEAFVWWKEQFGEDFYVELINHHLEEEKHVNEVLIQFAEKYGVKYFASNNVYYIEKSDATAHDVMLCVGENEKVNTPIGKGKGYRYGFPNQEYYFKSKKEMLQLFQYLPEALANTQEIVDKCEAYELSREVLLPKFDIPKEFETEDDYLRFLTYEGAKKRYGEITSKISERLDFELETIKKTGYPGYFLIVQDFTGKAREMGVSVGPGRGSAAGSAVAYCIGITNVDPIKYDLLFERFLNPDRVSMPDIDIDFDDVGREKVMNYVIEKYGKEQVAQIITFGTMAAKSAIRDVARALDFPLNEINAFLKEFPDNPKTTLKGILHKDGITDKLKKAFNLEDLQKAEKIRELAFENSELSKVLSTAKKLEGSVRQVGIHACGVIITPTQMSSIVPVTTAKDSDLQVTQFDNSVAESAGLLKMDFLGLQTLTNINLAIELIEKRHNIKIDPDQIPLDDAKTYELYQKGMTNATFQFESPGMQKYLRALKPNKFGDLIAMNALYRPGPLEYIPKFIKRKLGQEPITFEFEEMREYLEETYGITVYQEQVMLLSQKLAGFSKGDADVLRKAMGKKQKETLEKMKVKFVEGCKKNNLDLEKVEKIWKDWEAFAEYAFNKSHSTCYSVVAFQTAYLKAHYPAEFMAAVLTTKMADIKKVTFLMDECKKLNVPVLGPDVNESDKVFTVNTKGQIRFALTGIKGVGEAAVEYIVNDRQQNGPFKDIFDFVKRVDSKAVNKKTMESLALAGAFDCLQITRSQLFAPINNTTVLESLIKFGNAYKDSIANNQASLFGEAADIEVANPNIPLVEEWQHLEKLNKEKEVIGVYLTGHPLDNFKIEINAFSNLKTTDLNNIEQFKPSDQEMLFTGIVTACQHDLEDKKGDKWGRFTVEDYHGSHQFVLFKEEYLKFRHMIYINNCIQIRGKIQLKNKYNADIKELTFRIHKIDLISNLSAEVKRILLRIPETISSIEMNELTQTIKENKGVTRLTFSIFDSKTKRMVNLNVKNMGVQIDKSVLSNFEEIFGREPAILSENRKAGDVIIDFNAKGEQRENDAKDISIIEFDSEISDDE